MTPVAIRPRAPHPQAAPLTERTDNALCTAVNGSRTLSGGCFRKVNWLQRHPHLYGTYVEAENRGSL